MKRAVEPLDVVGASESHAGTQSGRGESSVPSGTMPSSSWRANVCSRHASQPWSNWPWYFSIHSGGAWCGEWHAPVAK